jgi:hypothetical protein
MRQLALSDLHLGFPRGINHVRPAIAVFNLLSLRVFESVLRFLLSSGSGTFLLAIGVRHLPSPPSAV